MNAKVLLVEDDPSIREVASIGLRGAGLTVDSAADGRRFRSTKPSTMR